MTTGYTGTTRTRSRAFSGWTFTAFVPFLLNLIACGAFVATRPPIRHADESVPAVRDEVRLSGSSAAALVIANRPLNLDSSWHAEEPAWIRTVGFLNRPALAAAASVESSAGSSSWRRARVYVLVSSLQWLFVGVVIMVLLNVRSRHSKSPVPVSHRE